MLLPYEKIDGASSPVVVDLGYSRKIDKLIAKSKDWSINNIFSIIFLLGIGVVLLYFIVFSGEENPYIERKKDRVKQEVISFIWHDTTLATGILSEYKKEQESSQYMIQKEASSLKKRIEKEVSKYAEVVEQPKKKQVEEPPQRRIFTEK